VERFADRYLPPTGARTAPAEIWRVTDERVCADPR
jgi:hypothetical protein